MLCRDNASATHPCRHFDTAVRFLLARRINLDRCSIMRDVNAQTSRRKQGISESLGMENIHRNIFLPVTFHSPTLRLGNAGIQSRGQGGLAGSVTIHGIADCTISFGIGGVSVDRSRRSALSVVWEDLLAL